MQRNLVRWAVAYGAAAFALLLGIDAFAQELGWPESVGCNIPLAFICRLTLPFS